MVEEFLTVEEVSRRLKLVPETVRDMVQRGDLPARKLGNRLRFDWKAVVEATERRSVVPASAG